jgi:hypothetical protein
MSQRAVGNQRFMPAASAWVGMTSMFSDNKVRANPHPLPGYGLCSPLTPTEQVWGTGVLSVPNPLWVPYFWVKDVEPSSASTTSSRAQLPSLEGTLKG